MVVNQAQRAFPQEGVAPAVEARVRTVWLPGPGHGGLPGCLGQGPRGWGGEQGALLLPRFLAALQVGVHLRGGVRGQSSCDTWG